MNSRLSLPNVQLPVSNTAMSKHHKVDRSISEVASSKKPTSSYLIVCPPAPDRRVSIADCAPSRSQNAPLNKELAMSGNLSRGRRTVSVARRPKFRVEDRSKQENSRILDFTHNFDIKNKFNTILRRITLFDRYRWIERLVMLALFPWFLYYINHMQGEIEVIRMQLDELEKDKSWVKWTLFTFLDKITTLEFLLFLLAAIATKVCMKGLEILQRKVELSQKLKEEELRTSFTLKMKENKLKSKNEIWRTLSDGLSKIVGTIVSAVIPSAGVEHILMKVLDMAEKRQKDRSKYKNREAKETETSSEAENDSSIHDQPQKNLNSSTNRLLKRSQPNRKLNNTQPFEVTQNLLHDKKFGNNINCLSGIRGTIIPPGSTLPVNLSKSQKPLIYSNTSTYTAHEDKFTQNLATHKDRPNTDSMMMTPTSTRKNNFRTQKKVSSGETDSVRPVFKS